MSAGPIVRQRLLRERRRRFLAAMRARRIAGARGQDIVLRINEPPLPETMAYLRGLYGPNVAVVVDPTAVD